MTRTAWVGLLAAAALTGCGSQPPERQIIEDAARALGGRERVLAIRTLVVEGTGTLGNLGQDMTPEATGQTFDVTSYTRAVDLEGRRARTELTRVATFRHFQGQAPQTLVQGIDGRVGYNVAANGQATRAADATANDRRAEFYHHPLAAVRAATDPGATLANARTHEGERVVDVTTAEGIPLTLAIDGVSGLPARVVSMAYNTNLGDVAVETRFADYQKVDGLQLPGRLTTRVDEFQTAEIRRATHRIDAEAGDLEAPAAAASAAPVAGPPPAHVTVEDVARGIWLLGGQSHHSVLVEFSDHLMLIEAPQNETRTLAVIARAREVVPGKPLTKVVVSHHHFDHSGGVRAAVSQGLTVIAHKASADFYARAVQRPHTIVADGLARNPKPLQIETVDDELVLNDAAMTVHLYHIAGNPHADTLLMAYFPRERLLVQADTFSPAAAVAPYAPNLLENVRKRNLRVDRLVPIHGQIVPFTELVKRVQPAT